MFDLMDPRFVSDMDLSPHGDHGLPVSLQTLVTSFPDQDEQFARTLRHAACSWEQVAWTVQDMETDTVDTMLEHLYCDD